MQEVQTHGRVQPKGKKKIWAHSGDSHFIEPKGLKVSWMIQGADGKNETIQATTTHPFYVEGIGFTPAGNLVAGEQVEDSSGNYGTVVSSVSEAEPQGVVSDERAVWLLAHVDECKSIEALAALVNVCAEAHRAPDWFVAAVKERAAARRSGAEAALRATAG